MIDATHFSLDTVDSLVAMLEGDYCIIKLATYAIVKVKTGGYL